MIKVSDTQPSGTGNKLWINSTASQGIVVPTYEEHEKVRRDIAPDYNPQGTYSVGDYVTYNDVLYKCNTAINTAEAWTSEHWTAVKVSEEITDLKGEISESERELEKTSGLKAIKMLGAKSLYNGQYIKTNVAIGTTVSLTPIGSNGFRYAIVQCEEGDKFVINATGGTSPKVWAFINSENVLLSRDTQNDHTVSNLELIAPSNSAYLIINDNSGSISYIGADRITNTEHRLNELETKIVDYTGGQFTEIPANADLNEYLTIGNYYCLETNTASILNKPYYTTYAFNLIVKSGFGNDDSYLTQYFISRFMSNNSKIAVRNVRKNGTIYEWKEIAFGDIATTTADGLMSKNDKVKLETLEINLNNYTGGAYVAIPSNADLNNYTIPGNYVTNSNDVLDISHRPAGLNRQFRLIVRKSGTDAQATIIQTLYPIQIRCYNDNLGSIDYAYRRTGRTDGITSEWSGLAVSNLATGSNSGLMDKWDKRKLDTHEDYICFEKTLYPSLNSNVSDLLQLEKINCYHHDNFYREDNLSEIGSNGSRTMKYLYSDMKPFSEDAENIVVGISNHKAIATNPNNVDGDVIRIKYKNVDLSIPYKVILSFEGKGILVISPIDTENYLYVSADDNSFKVGGVGSLEIEPVNVTHNLANSTIVVYVYAHLINVYVAGQKKASVPIRLLNDRVGILFKASEVNEIAYTSFSYFTSAKNEFSYQDDGIEQARLFSNEIVNNSSTADYSYGILLDTDITRNSLKSIRFEQRKEDSRTEYRSEITIKNPRGTTENSNRPLQTKIFEYDMYLPDDYTLDTTVEILWQMHHTPDGVVADGLIPPIAFGTENGHFILEVRSFDFKAQNSDEIVDRHTYDLGEYTPGTWYHFLVFIREGYLQEHNPCLAIWMDGNLVHYKREPNAYNTTNGAYLKMGIYKPQYVYDADTGTTKRVIYIDNLYCWM